MGFWKVMENMIKGKPAFEVPVDPADNTGATTPDKQSNTPPATSGQKVIPTTTVTHCKSHINGTDMTVTVWLTNTSSVEIELDKVSLLGQTFEISRRLMPQQAHEIKVYDGRMPTDDSAHKANIYYKSLPDRDYFCADYMIEYNYEDNGTYTIEDLRPESYGVRDI